jgi:hypothetical protein
MQGLSLATQLSLYVLVALLGLYNVLLWGWQFMVLRGKAYKNPDGSVDDWHEQKTHYGIAFADVFLSCPVGIAGVILTLLGSRWGIYLLALDSFFFLWANIMTTAVSLRFAKPKINFMWFMAFPFGAILGLAFLVWTFVHFDSVYQP